MILEFDVKFGVNKLELELFDGSVVSTLVDVKYGENRVVFPTSDKASTSFNIKFGHNIVDVPITSGTKAFCINGSTISNFWQRKVTIYNDVVASDTQSRCFDRFVIEKCSIQGGILSKADSTIEKIANAKTVWTKDVQHYLPPNKYAALPLEFREKYFTVQSGDYVVLGEVEDVVNNAADFASLQKKYDNFGFKITSVSPNIYGMSVDNISFTNV